jgi:hypothetical protein
MIVGPDFYTLVLEGTYGSPTEFEQSAQATMGNPEWQKWYPGITALCDGGHREILNVVE